MNKKETVKIMAILNATYPTQFNKLSEEVKDTMIEIWQDMFKEDDYNLVSTAVKTHIANDRTGFIPAIGQLKEHIRKISFPDAMTEQEAWNRIYKALENGYYNSHKEFERLPEILQMVVGSPGQLKQWSIMELDTVNSVIASNVQRSYRVLLQREQEQQIINPNQLDYTKLKELEA